VATTDFSPGRHDLILVRGDSAAVTLTFTEDDGTTAVDLSGHTWRAQVRQTYDSAASELDFTVDDADAATGVLVLELDDTDWTGVAATLPTDKWYWDLEGTRTADTFVQTFLGGKVKVVGDVSRA
jgi:hypothetical protein